MKRLFFQAGLLCLLCSSGSIAQTTEKLSLTNVIELAQRNNPEVLNARKEIDAAEARILQAGRIPNPELGASWNESRNLFGLGDANERDLSISQQIEFPTKRGNRIEVASIDRDESRLRLERITSLVSTRVKKAYYGLLLSGQLVASLEEQLTLLRDFQQLLNDRYQAGDNNYLDVVRLRVEVTRLNNDIADARRETRSRRYQLNILIGRESESDLVLTDSLAHPGPVLARDSLMKALPQTSATLKLARSSVNRRQSLLSLARKSYLPDFEIGISNQKRGDLINLWGVEFRMMVPLWFWQEPKGQVLEALTQTDIADVTRSSIERRIKANILDALDRLDAVQVKLKSFDGSLVLDAKDILSTAITRYQNNQIDVLNLLDVYRLHRSTKLEYLRLLHDYATTAADLESATELPSEE